MEARPDPDRALVERCRDPQSEDFEAAFEALYRRYRDRVYAIGFRVTGNSSDAMDVVQEAFSQVFRSISKFRGDSLFRTWLFRIVVHGAIDSRRTKRSGIRKQTEALETDADTALVDDSIGPADTAQVSELGRHVHDSIQSLSPKLRAILVLRHLEHQSYEELAETLAMSIGTVKSRLARAHVALEKVLEGTLEPFGYRHGPDGLYQASEPAEPGESEGGHAEGVA